MNGVIVALSMFKDVMEYGCRGIRGLSRARSALGVREDASHLITDGGDALVKEGSDEFI